MGGKQLAVQTTRSMGVEVTSPLGLASVLGNSLGRCGKPSNSCPVTCVDNPTHMLLKKVTEGAQEGNW